MRKLLIALTVVMALCLTTNSALAGITYDADATADVNCIVEEIAEWSGNYSTIQLPDVTDQSSYTADANAVKKLYMNANVDITASATAQLKKDGTDPNNVLVTEYKLTFDGNGSAATGVASPTTWRPHNTFATGGESVVFVSEDGEVDVRLHVRAKNVVGELADAGTYSTIQTLTIAWTP